MEQLIITVAAMLIFWVLAHVILTGLSMRRAFKNKPFTYKSGLAICTKTNKFVGFRTPVYRDHKTGNEYLGKPKRIN